MKKNTAWMSNSQCLAHAGAEMDDGKDRHTQITLNNNVLNLADDDRRRRIEELQRKVLTNAKPGNKS